MLVKTWPCHRAHSNFQRCPNMTGGTASSAFGNDHPWAFAIWMQGVAWPHVSSSNHHLRRSTFCLRRLQLRSESCYCILMEWEKSSGLIFFSMPGVCLLLMQKAGCGSHWIWDAVFKQIGKAWKWHRTDSSTEMEEEELRNSHPWETETHSFTKFAVWMSLCSVPWVLWEHMGTAQWRTLLPNGLHD